MRTISNNLFDMMIENRLDIQISGKNIFDQCEPEFRFSVQQEYAAENMKLKG